ncbi:hypothetical protein ACA910_020687 [Epithemia clementina (nom. ined.)]
MKVSNHLATTLHQPPEADQLDHNNIVLSRDCLLISDPVLAEWFLEYPKFDTAGNHPFHFSTIAMYQSKDDRLKAIVANNTRQGKSFLKQLGATKLVCVGTDQDW